MWVRVATFEGGNTEELDRLMDERMSSGEMTPAEGMSSVLILDDKDAKRRKFFAFFDSRNSLEAAEAGFDQQGDTIPEEIRGHRTSVHSYDVVIYDGNVEAAKAKPERVTGEALLHGIPYPATTREPRARPGSRGYKSRARRRSRPKTSDRALTRMLPLVFP
jgi:hypothetical protein